MFRPKLMVEVDILLLQRDLQAALRGLADAGIIHLQRMATADTQAKTVASVEQSLLERYASFKALLQRLCEDLGVAGGVGNILAIEDFAC